MEDVIFLVRKDLIELAQLQRVVEESLPRVREFDIDPSDLLAHLQTVIGRLK